MKIKNVAIDTVIPYARNPRRNQGAIAGDQSNEYGMRLIYKDA